MRSLSPRTVTPSARSRCGNLGVSGRMRVDEWKGAILAGNEARRRTPLILLGTPHPWMSGGPQPTITDAATTVDSSRQDSSVEALAAVERVQDDVRPGVVVARDGLPALGGEVIS